MARQPTGRSRGRPRLRPSARGRGTPRLHSNPPAPVESNKPYHFFKIILENTIEEKKMRLPLKFLTKFGDELSDIASLQLPNGRVWQVGVTKDKEDTWFDYGWSKFIQSNSVRYGYFLVFKYNGNSSFDVVICDLSTSEIDYPTNEEAIRNVKIERNDDGDDDAQVLDSSPPSRNEESSHKKTPSSENPPSRRVDFHSQGRPDLEKRDKRVKKDEVVVVDLTDEDEQQRDKLKKNDQIPSSSNDKSTQSKTGINENGKAHEVFCSERYQILSTRSGAALAADMFMPKNPAFKVELQPYNFDRSMVYVPKSFADRYMPIGVYEEIKIQCPDGKKLPVKVCNGNGGRRLRFGKGWNYFSKYNGLKQGDVCVFELINLKDLHLKLTVFPKCSK